MLRSIPSCYYARIHKSCTNCIKPQARTPYHLGLPKNILVRSLQPLSLGANGQRFSALTALGH